MISKLTNEKEDKFEWMIQRKQKQLVGILNIAVEVIQVEPDHLLPPGAH